MDKESPTIEEAKSFIRAANQKLLPNHEIFKQFRRTMTNFKQGRISSVFVAGNVNYLFRNEPALLLQFHKFLPRQDERKNQELNIKKSKVGFKKSTTFKNALEYVNRVQKGLENHPDMLRKFFDLMDKYKNDLDKEKLKQGLFSLFKLHPEYENEFMQLTTEEPYPESPNNVVFKVREITKYSLEGRMVKIDDEMFENDMLISRIKSAIKNIVRLLVECSKNPGTIRVTKFLTCTNLKHIQKYCHVDLQKSSNIQECACAVVGQLRHQLELTRNKNGDAIRIKRAEALKNYLKSQETRMRKRARTD